MEVGILSNAIRALFRIKMEFIFNHLFTIKNIITG
jgi:hypothetical protein